MSIASEISRLQTAKSALKTSIENKGITVPSATTLDGYAALVDQISGGGGGGGASLSDPVRFFDYDGALVYSYSAADFANLNAFPDNPSHSGLTAQGWNWALADAKTYVAAYGKLDIGQMYITDNGKTRIYISLTDSAGLSPYLGVCPNGTVVVNWGDGTATSTLTGTSLTTIVRAQHTYAAAGNYVITLTASSGTFAISGGSSPGSYLLTRNNTNDDTQYYYTNSIKKVELGANVSIANYAFSYCSSLVNITIPSGITSMGANVFQYCPSLKSITIPSGMTNMGTYTFLYCYGLTRVIMSNSVTSISIWAFRECYSLLSITIPSSVTSIGEYAFYNCRAIESITVPNNVTSMGQSAFCNCYALKSITIPSGVTSIADNVYSSLYSLPSITIPNSVTTLSNNSFSGCHSLASITIPSSVTSIGKSTFYSCRCLNEIHLLRATPPTLVDKNGFSNLNSECKFYVPSASLATYQSATNWSYYRTKMVGE